MICRARRVCAAAGVAVCSAGIAACGSGPKPPVATQVCQGALQAVKGQLNGASMKIVSRNPDDIQCRLSDGETTVEVEAQASPRAWEQFDTLTVHAAQAFGPGTVYKAAKMPQDLSGLGYSAAWIPGDHQLVATNGTQSAGGSYVTVTVKHGKRRSAPSVAALERVATATLKSAPRGPSPGPAPS